LTRGVRDFSLGVMKKKTLLFLLAANVLLLTLSWIMALIAYPRLPQEMPLWINFIKQQAILMKKSLLFFIYPSLQTLFCLGFWWLSRVNFSFKLPQGSQKCSISEVKALYASLRKEFIYLTLIFFNLIFIHLQRSLIFLAHTIGEGVNRFYFSLLFVIILILILNYRLRVKLIARKARLIKK